MSFSFSRRAALKGMVASAGALALTGCAADEEGDDSELDATETQELLKRYKKFVFLVMENRSFDHYFGHLSLPVSQGGEGRTNVNGFSADLSVHANVDLNGNKIKPFRSTELGIGDIDHEWEACHAQFAGGKNNGFVKAHHEDIVRLKDGDEATPAHCFGTKDEQGVIRCAEDPAAPMAFYGRQETPVYHKLLDEYALCDNWFASVMGPTWPNRYYLHAGSAGSRKVNKPLSGIGSVARNSIFGAVADRKREIALEYPGLDVNRQCVNFFADVPLLPIMFPTALGLGDGLDGINFLPNFNFAHLFDAPREGGVNDLTRLSNSVFGDKVPDKLLKIIAGARRSPTFETMCKQGTLPPISYIEPPYQLAPMDDHPPHNIMAGQAFVASVYKMLRESPDWEHTLLVVTYDEHGSFYDHVAPGSVADDEDGEFRQLGFRVPTLVIGKGIKRQHVSKVRYDHCSLLSTVNTRFGLESPNARVTNAKTIAECISRSGATGASGGLRLASLDLSYKAIMDSAELADGQAEIVHKVFHGHVPFEAKKIFTEGMFSIFDRLGVATVSA
jgi:phospholipase C